MKSLPTILCLHVSILSFLFVLCLKENVNTYENKDNNGNNKMEKRDFIWFDL
jgi:hypothetical protein